MIAPGLSEPQQSASASDHRVAVIGGGIAGLSAALTLHEAGLMVVVVEAGDRPGGKIWTDRSDGYTIEAGPDSILSYKPAGLALIERIGLLDRVINTREDGQGSYILRHGTLQPLPEGMTALVPVDVRPVIETQLLSWKAKFRLAGEYFLPARRNSGDESVGGFVRRRLGDEFYQNMAEPLLSGIYAGDANQLSLMATFPRLRMTEQQHGGMIRGALAQRRPASNESTTSRRWTPFISLQQGLGEIIDGLVNRLEGVQIRTGCQARAVRPTQPGYRIDLASGESLEASAIILATPAWVTAGLLRPMASQLADELDRIPYVSTATISMAFETQRGTDGVTGRGFLIPRAERRVLTAVTWSSSKFAGRAPEGALLMRGYAGHASDQESLNQSDDDLIAAVRRELAEITGFTAEPLFARLYRWPRALPQYNLGHLERVASIEALTARYPGLALTGAGYRGVGIPDCIQDGIKQAAGLVAHLQSLAMTPAR